MPRYQQFIGTCPGIVVELLDDSVSPYRVGTDSGFEFLVGADEFKAYYRREAEPTPAKWIPFLTDREAGLVEVGKMRQVMDVVWGFEPQFQDYDKARAFCRDLTTVLDASPSETVEAIRAKMKELGWDDRLVQGDAITKIRKLPGETRELLKDDRCAWVHFLETTVGDSAAAAWDQSQDGSSAPGPKKAVKKNNAKVRRTNMKNVEMEVEGNILRLTVDCSKDMGPSKSGKTILVGSSEGTKAIPGRPERMGLNVYREEGKKPAVGRQKEFKNVVMDLNGDILTVTVDLSQDLGPSKSGKTDLVASTGGNQLVYGRSEKIGLNVYRVKE
ncbi:MAG: hypothetical protein AB1646_10965 [Thermodesulfobacteriota bacterium]